MSGVTAVDRLRDADDLRRRQVVGQPLRAPGADPLVDGLRAAVVERGLLRQRDAAALAGAITTGEDEPSGHLIIEIMEQRIRGVVCAATRHLA